MAEKSDLCWRIWDWNIGNMKIPFTDSIINYSALNKIIKINSNNNK